MADTEEHDMTGILEQPKTDVRIVLPAAPAERTTALPRRPIDRDGVPALLVEHLTKRFNVGRKKKPVLAGNDITLTSHRGEIYGVLGANGSGKSTLIRLVSTLLTLDEGRAEVFGHDIERDEMAVKRLINRVSVDAAFF
jgi:ABC-2 type transport system ATP-binding protein